MEWHFPVLTALQAGSWSTQTGLHVVVVFKKREGRGENMELGGHEGGEDLGRARG